MNRFITEIYILPYILPLLFTAGISYLLSIMPVPAGISHNFNNMLSGVVGYLAMAKENRQPGEPVYEYLSLAGEADVHAKNLTRQLMNFARGGDPIKETMSVADVTYNAEMLVPKSAHIDRV